jgi:predicted PurR-regulated permease PerM
MHPAPPLPRIASPRVATPSGVATALFVMIAIAVLYMGREIFIPFSLAVLLAFVLAPLVEHLQRWRVPKVPAVVLVVALAVALLGSLSMLIGSQLVTLAKNLPDYQQTMLEKLHALRASTSGDGAIDRATGLFKSLRRELESAGQGRREALPVQVQPAPTEPLQVIGRVLAPLLGPVGMAGLVIVFLVFVLLERHDLRDRFIRLTGGGVHRTTGALNEAASRVSRYLLMQLIVNATYGVPIGIGLHFIGVPNALLWGLLATLLRFVPYLGPFIAALFPLALAFAVDPGWSMLAWTAALIIAVELISNNVVEPWLYGSSTGLSPVAILLSAIFWTLLWGPVGLILATPLTVCIAVMGRYVPQLGFFDVLLGSAPVLAPQEQLYQRLLAGNAEEAIELAESYVVEHSRAEFYECVALPALCLADRERVDAASAETRKQVALGLEAVVRELGGKADGAGASASVLCIAGRWELDAAAAMVLAHTLAEQSIDVCRLSAESVTPDAVGSLDLGGVEAVCLSYLHPAPQSYARFVCRRLKRRKPRLKVLVALWNIGPDAASLERLAEEVGADAVATSLADAVTRVRGWVAGAAPTMMAPPLPEREAERLAALDASGLGDARHRARLDRVARRVADAFDMPIALVSLVDESCQLWKGAAGLPADLDAARQGAREYSICGHVVAAEAPLVVEDTLRDPRFSANPLLRARGIRFYAGAPLRTASGFVIGSLCVLDTRPRTLGAREVKLLQALADEVMASVAQAVALQAPPIEQPA